MGTLASMLIRTLGQAAARRFETATRNPVGAQQRKLLEIMERNRDTEFGREFGFRAVRGLSDLRNTVPVTTYEDLRARMERVVRGERNVLTAEQPVMFARTSGTTGEPKYVPITRTCQGRDHQDQMRTWFAHAIRAHPSIFSGTVISLVSPAVEGRTPSGIPYGSTSGHIYRNMPRIIRGTYLIPYELFEVEHYESKYYAIMRMGIGSRVTFVATANPSSILKMCELANRDADHLLRDLHDGSLKTALEIPAHVRRLIEARLRPDPGRARQLERARSRRNGRLLPADYWPDLALIGCWKGGTVGSYLNRFPEWFEPDTATRVPVRDWGYLSSEARCSIPLSDDGAGGVLTVATNVYEFVSAEEVASNDNWRQWNFRGVDALETGKEYYVFFTTTGGLYRYDINDVIEVVGRYNETPVIVFRRKGRGMTNLTGEKVSVNQVIGAFEAAAAACRVAIEHFRAEADPQASRYVFCVEASAGIPAERRLPFLRALEDALAASNIEYAAKRASLRLNSPVLHVMRPGWYDSEKRALVASGKRLFQAKTQLLATEMTSHRSPFLESAVEWSPA